MNIIAYIFYLFITYIITVHVGLTFYRNGRLYILNLLHSDEKLTDFINKMLLTGYYLLNLGYAALCLRSWQTIYTWEQLLGSVFVMTGKIMLLLAVIHFMNMAVIYLFSTMKHHFHHHKN